MTCLVSMGCHHCFALAAPHAIRRGQLQALPDGIPSFPRVPRLTARWVEGPLSVVRRDLPGGFVEWFVWWFRQSVGTAVLKTNRWNFSALKAIFTAVNSRRETFPRDQPRWPPQASGDLSVEGKTTKKRRSWPTPPFPCVDRRSNYNR